MITAIPESRVDNLQQGERDSSPEKCSARAQHLSYSSPHFADTVDMGDRHFKDNPCHPVVDFTTAQERASASQSNELAHHEATNDLCHITNSGTASSQLDADVEMHDAALRCMEVTSSLNRESEGFSLDEQNTETGRDGSSVEQCLSYLEDGDASTPSAEDDMSNTHGQQTPLSDSSHPHPQVQPKYVEMSHVEIQNSRPMKTGKHTVEEASSE